MKIIIYALILLGLLNTQDLAKNDVYINLINPKETYGPKDIIWFEVVNNSEGDMLLTIGEQYFSKNWRNGLEDIVNDLRRKEQIMFKIAPNKKRRIQAYDVSKVFADERLWAKKTKSTLKNYTKLNHADSVSLQYADSILNHKPILHRKRLVANLIYNNNHLNKSAYSKAYNTLY